MVVSERMSKHVATVTPENSVATAFKVLKERRHSQLPVIDDKGKLVGLVTEKLLTEVSPSKATSLSVYELNYLLSKTKVSYIMKTDIFTTTPDTIIEEAALIMKTNDIGSLPVVDEGNILVGIVTRLDIFSAFIDIMGVNEKGTRIVITVDDKMGTLADISQIIKQFGVNITHISNYKSNDDTEILLKINTTEVEDLISALEKNNYKILSLTKMP